jgi:hypothetical protein
MKYFLISFRYCIDQVINRSIDYNTLGYYLQFMIKDIQHSKNGKFIGKHFV